MQLFFNKPDISVSHFLRLSDIWYIERQNFKQLFVIFKTIVRDPIVVLILILFLRSVFHFWCRIEQFYFWAWMLACIRQILLNTLSFIPFFRFWRKAQQLQSMQFLKQTIQQTLSSTWWRSTGQNRLHEIGLFTIQDIVMLLSWEMSMSKDLLHYFKVTLAFAMKSHSPKNA